MKMTGETKWMLLSFACLALLGMLIVPVSPWQMTKTASSNAREAVTEFSAAANRFLMWHQLPDEVRRAIWVGDPRALRFFCRKKIFQASDGNAAFRCVLLSETKKEVQTGTEVYVYRFADRQNALGYGDLDEEGQPDLSATFDRLVVFRIPGEQTR